MLPYHEPHPDPEWCSSVSGAKTRILQWDPKKCKNIKPFCAFIYTRRKSLSLVLDLDSWQQQLLIIWEQTQEETYNSLCQNPQENQPQTCSNKQRLHQCKRCLLLPNSAQKNHRNGRQIQDQQGRNARSLPGVSQTINMTAERSNHPHACSGRALHTHTSQANTFKHRCTVSLALGCMSADIPCFKQM